MCIGKTLFRTALIGGLAVGGIALIAGPNRVAAGFHQARFHLVSWFDANVDDPIIIQQQLKRLQREYPTKIRETIRHIAEIDAEMSAVRRDRDVASRMIQTNQGDLASLRNLVDKAGLVQQASYGDRPVVVAFQGRHLTVDEAYAKAHTITQTMANYSERLTVNERDLDLLVGQRERMVAQLDELQSEYTAFQGKVAQIQRQIASIQRNESITDSLEEREAMLTDSDRWHVANLDQIVDRLSAVQSEQEAVLQALSARAIERDYEKEALGRIVLDELKNPFDYSVNNTQQSFPGAPIVVDENTPAPQVNEVEDSSQAVASLDN